MSLHRQGQIRKESYTKTVISRLLVNYMLGRYKILKLMDMGY